MNSVLSALEYISDNLTTSFCNSSVEINRWNGIKYFPSKVINRTAKLALDTIQSQLQTADRLKFLMNNKNYGDAIKLFSLKQQENILEIQKNQKMFEYWCKSWTFDDAKYNRYVNKIIAGKAYIIFENDEWKINEK